MATWDVLHEKTLEVEHAVPDEQVRQSLAEGRLSRDDCVRRPGEDRWWRIYERAEFRLSSAEVAAAAALEEPPRLEQVSLRNLLADAEPSQPGIVPRPRPATPPAPTASPAAPAARPVAPAPAAAVAAAPAHAEEEISFRKKKHHEEEELDMTPLVDVAMQLILFFMVTSTILVQSCLEFPKPAPEGETAKQQPPPPTLDELERESVMVKVKADNTIWVDEEQVKDADLAKKLESLKREGNKAGIVINAEADAFHEKVVAIVNAANVAALKPIKMATPKKAAKKSGGKKRAIKS
jgi:biopolymer transport protein ExbD